ncbi:MAG: hypothetical protein HY360_08290, partial [Verrucomicrobia bacterium]|nr:hypothetical protein [Verrucomicrobiota bacterium]
SVKYAGYVIRAFVKMRAELTKNQELARRLAEIEKTLIGHDTALRDLYNKIRPLLLPPPEPKRREIGFHVKESTAKSWINGITPRKPWMQLWINVMILPNIAKLWKARITSIS